MREFLSPIFITGRSRPLALGGFIFLGVHFLWAFASLRYPMVVFLYSITRETHQRQLTRRLWPARWRRERSAFEDTEFSVAKQPCTETTDAFNCVNALHQCPPVLGHGTSSQLGPAWPAKLQNFFSILWLSSRNWDVVKSAASLQPVETKFESKLSHL